MGKKVYISGPMSGIEGFNFEAFDKAAKFIESRGDFAVNPAVRGREWVAKNGNRPLTKAEYRKMMKECKAALRECGSIFLLKGWENSNGAKEELSLAILRDMEVEIEK